VEQSDREVNRWTDSLIAYAMLHYVIYIRTKWVIITSQKTGSVCPMTR